MEKLLVVIGLMLESPCVPREDDPLHVLILQSVINIKSNSYHLINLMSEEFRRFEKQVVNPCGTRPIGRPAICSTVSPRFSSVMLRHMVWGMLDRSGTHTKQAYASCLFPYSFATVKGTDVEAISGTHGTLLLRHFQ